MSELLAYFLLGFCLGFGSVSAQNSQSSQFISLRVGQATLNGTVESIPGGRSQRVYYAFKGIPYAVPPVGPKRWMDPEVLELNEPEYDATKYGPKCLQWLGTDNGGSGSVIGDENCLTLNIFTSSLPSIGGVGHSRALNPVMVYIHGGGFMYGGGDVAGPGRFLKHDVVLITINYRLGVMGYLSTGDKDLAGNYGSLDQIIALDWIQKYVEGFGGNPRQVTIMGHSAGAASVHLLTLSKRATGKFHQAIIQSGSGLCDWAVERNPLEYATKVAAATECTTPLTSDMVACLRRANGDALIRTQQNMLDYWVFPLHTAPVLDGEARGAEAFLPDDPATLMDQMDRSDVRPVPIVTGVTQDEGFMGYAILHSLIGNEKFTNESYFNTELIPRVLRGILDDENEEIDVISEAVRRHYFHGLNMSEEVSVKRAISELSDLFGDVLFYSCHREMLEKYAAHNLNIVYSYVFTHKTPTSPKIMSKAIQGLRKQTVHHTLFDSAVPHGEDMFYTFDPVDIFPGNAQQAMNGMDQQVAEIVTRTWFAFARDGNLTAGLHGLTGYPPWRPIKPGSIINYYNLASVPLPMGVDFKKREALFWLRTVPYLTELGDNITQLEDNLKIVEEDLDLFKILFWVALTLSIVFLIATVVLALVLWRKRTTGKATM